MAAVAFSELRLDEAALATLDHLVAEATHELVEKRAITEHIARIEQCRADGDVSAGELQALVDRSGRVADLQAQIPQYIEDVFDDALAPGRLLVRQQKEEIDVRAGCQQGAAVAAGRDDRQALGVGGVVTAVDVRARVVEHEGNEFVLEGRKTLGTAPPFAV